MMDIDAWKGWIGQVVVVDTNSSFLYIGTLADVRPHFVVLKDVDTHDRADSLATKERYVMDVKRFGVRPNRKEVSVRLDLVVSVSRLEDVIEY
ncbi:MAG: hypothetical protein HYY16_15625 [Planctomycetes bacterium]|nr:hypothetical protein [Planctomycetota bacterium]